MEPHAVPQNVTTFEFHLVGDMTVKQFGYLAGGIALAYLTFVVIFPLLPFIAVPLIIIFSLFGISFAFLPYNNRPLEHWVKAYFKAISSPTQAQWLNPFNLKSGSLNQDATFQNRLNLYLSTLNIAPEMQSAPAQSVSKIALQSQTSNRTPLNLSRITPTPPQTPPTAPSQPKTTTGNAQPLPSSEELSKLVLLANQSQQLQSKIAETEQQMAQLKSVATSSKDSGVSYANEYHNIYNNLQTLISQAQQLSGEISQITRTSAASAKSQHVVVVTPPKPENAQVNLTSSPNVINGIVTDTTGNYLEGVIVIIHNKANIPVRALKTNKLGQFTGATPLPSGVYNITLEKDSLEFDTLEVTLNGEVLAPIQITAKKGVIHG